MSSLLNAFSLEITAADGAALASVLELLPPATEVSITCLPDEAADLRLAAATAVKAAGFIPVPHICARGVGSSTELTRFAQRATTEAGTDRAFVIAGDVAKPVGPYQDALAVINSGLLARHGFSRIGIAGYPDGHPHISQDALWAALQAKRDSLKRQNHSYEIVTQFSFDKDAILAWLKRLRADGEQSLVRIGIPGPTSVRSLMSFAARCGVAASTKALAKYGLSLTKLVGQTGPDRMLRQLQDELQPSVHGAVAIHFFPFGGVRRSLEWIQQYQLGARPR